MIASALKGQRLIAAFFLGCLLFNYPLLSLFNLPLEVGGIPLLFVFVFGGWALLILLMALLAERGSD